MFAVKASIVFRLMKQNTRLRCSKACANKYIAELWKVHPERQAIARRMHLNVDNDLRIKRRNDTFYKMVADGKIKGRKGAACNWWKGGIATSRQKERSSKEYINWRTAVFIRDNRTCIKCGYHGRYIEADHYPYGWTKYPEHRYDVNNGRTLCKKCHKEVTFVTKEWQNGL